MIVDAGVGTASDVTIAMELGADGVLLNTGIAHAKDPVKMARRDAACAGGRTAGVSGRPDRQEALRHRLQPVRGRDQLHPRRVRAIRRSEEQGMILCVGTTPAVQRTMVFGHFHLDEVNRAKRVRRQRGGQGDQRGPGGGPAGAQGALHRLHRRGRPGGSSSMNWIAREWPIALSKCPFATRICTTILDEQTGHTTELVEESQPVDPARWSDLEDLIAGELPAARLWSSPAACRRDRIRPFMPAAAREPRRRAWR